MGFIVMLDSPAGKSYIGSTRAKPNKIFTLRYDDSFGLDKDISKYGFDAFSQSWYFVPDKDLEKHRILMIEVMDTFAPFGYNIVKKQKSWFERIFVRTKYRQQ
jgi:hypothetical protein